MIEHNYTNVFKLLFENTNTVNIVLNAAGEIILFNKKAEKMTGYTTQDVMNTTPWALFFSKENADKAYALFQTISPANSSIETEMELTSREGEKRLVQWKVDGVSIHKEETEFIIITGIDISTEQFYKLKAESYAEKLESLNIKHIIPLERTNKQLNRLSLTDHLTGLYNRRHFDDVLKNLLKYSKRGETTISLLMCDVDYFKPYNDTYGHVEGDLALKQVAAVLSDCSQRSDDIVARYGGEEFALILPGTDSNGALNVASCIMKKLAHKKIPHEISQHMYLTLSIGIVTTDISLISNSNDLIRLADKQLYEAKTHGRNNIMSLNHISHS